MIEPVVARRIKLVGFDVDGTLTDGGLFIGAGIELKRFDIQDGLGVNLLKRAGLLTAVVTGRAGEAARIRSEEMGIDEFVISGGQKLTAFEAILARRGLKFEECAFVGDDLPDIPIMRQVGLPEIIRVDHGSPFASVGLGRLSQLSVWWIEQGIEVEFTRPASPQDNGSHERMHRDL